MQNEISSPPQGNSFGAVEMMCIEHTFIFDTIFIKSVASACPRIHTTRRLTANSVDAIEDTFIVSDIRGQT